MRVTSMTEVLDIVSHKALRDFFESRFQPRPQRSPDVQWQPCVTLLPRANER
jgi:hypothetical protein